MAQVIPCDICSEEQAVAVVSMVATGDVQGIGIQCLAQWAFDFGLTLHREAGAPLDMSSLESSAPNLAVVANLSDLDTADIEASAATHPSATPARRASRPRAPRKAVT